MLLHILNICGSAVNLAEATIKLARARKEQDNFLIIEISEIDSEII